MGQRIESRGIDERIRLSVENLVFALGDAAGADRASLFVVDDAYASQRFNPEVDAISGYRTQSRLCVPVRGPAGRISAVLELLNPIDRPGFSADDEREISSYAPELSALLGACGSIA